MDIDAEEMTQFIEENWADAFSYPLIFGEVISNFGSDNIIFSTADDETYVFRIIYAEPDAIHNGSQIYEYLNKLGLPVPLPIKTDSGDYLVEVWDEEEEEMMGYSIHSFVEGDEEVDRSDLASLLPEMAMWFGKLHSALAALDISDLELMGMTQEEMRESLENTEIGFSDVLLEVPPSHPLVEEMYHFWKKWKQTIDFSSLTKGFIHGDMGPGANILIQEGKVTGLLDLIEVGFGYYIQDVGSFAMYGLLYQNEEWLELFKLSYLEHAPIGEEEFEYLPFFILWRFLIQALYFDWRLRTGHIQGVEDESGNEEGFDDAIQMLSFWKDKYGHLIH